jgi:hypothetical protein
MEASAATKICHERKMFPMKNSSILPLWMPFLIKLRKKSKNVSYGLTKEIISRYKRANPWLTRES